MNEMKENLNQRNKVQASVAFCRLRDALTEHVEDMNMRLQAGLTGVIYVRPSQDNSPVILFSDFPHPNEQVSYMEASKRLLNPCF